MHVSVSAQQHDPDSLLNFTRKLIAAYKKSPEIGWGRFELLEQEQHCVIAHSLTGSTGQVVALHNFAADACTVSFTLADSEKVTHLVDLLGDEPVSLGDDGRIEINLDGFGYLWLRIVRAGEKRIL